MNTTPTQRQSAYPAHLGWRILAIIYDGLPLIAILFFSSIVLLLAHGGKPAIPGTAWSFFTILVYWSIVGCYAVISWQRGGQTMGMRPWRLMVVNQDGKSAQLTPLCLRYAIVSLSGGLTLLWCLLDSQKRGLHDIASNTLMVRKQASESVEKVQNSMPPE
ncbi:MAG: RDD family protein [Arenimonas sp.]